MSIDKVKEYFKKYDMDDKIIVHDKTTATVQLAAIALNCLEGEIAKSLTFMCGDEVIMVLCAGDKKIDNSKFKTAFGYKAKMIEPLKLDELVGHEQGGVCPFGVKDGVKVYLDETLKEYKYVYPACGSSNSAIKLSIEELEKYSGYIKWVDVCKEV